MWTSRRRVFVAGLMTLFTVTLYRHTNVQVESRPPRKFVLGDAMEVSKGTPHKDNSTLPRELTKCSGNITADFLHQTLQYLTKSLHVSEELIREPRTESSGGRAGERKRLNYLENYKNPCWLEELPSKPFKYPQFSWNKMVHTYHLRRVYNETFPLFTARQRSTDETAVYKNATRLRCLPYVYLLGMHKAGTTDFYHFLTKHPHFVTVSIREPQFWSRLPNITGFSDYLDLYDFVSERIRQGTESDGHNGYHYRIAIDGSTHTFQGYLEEWQDHPWNLEQGKQCVTLPQHLNYLSPKSKYILLLRHPIEWMTSCLNYFKGREPYRYYHNNLLKTREGVLKEISDLENCFSHTEDSLFCVYNQIRNNYCHVGVAVYYVWAKSWIDIVGYDKILIINSNEYYSDRLPVIEKAFTFLDLPPVTTELSEEIRDEKQKNVNRRKKLIELDDVTREAIMKFLSPWNQKLADLLNDTSFKWF